MTINICGYDVLIDRRDYEKVAAVKKWSLKIEKNKGPYFHTYINGKPTSLHRIILNAPSGTVVDHKSCNTLNNYRSNLRICDYTKSAQNQRKRSYGCTSRYKGVSKQLAGNTWRARICVNGKHIYLGNFPTEKAAHLAYCRAAKEYFGEFARLA